MWDWVDIFIKSREKNRKSLELRKKGGIVIQKKTSSKNPKSQDKPREVESVRRKWTWEWKKKACP